MNKKETYLVGTDASGEYWYKPIRLSKEEYNAIKWFIEAFDLENEYTIEKLGEVNLDEI